MLEMKPGQFTKLEIITLRDDVASQYCLAPVSWSNNANESMSVTFIVSQDTLIYTVQIPSNTDFGSFTISATSGELSSTFDISITPVMPCVKTIQIVASTPQ